MFEKFLPGDKVFLLHLQEEGVVTRLNGAEMVYVQLEDMEIPVYCSDISRAQSKIITPAISQASERKNPTEESSTEKSIPSIRKDSGLFLSFEPVKDKTGEIVQFRVSLVNDTSFPLTFRYRFFLSGDTHFQMDKTALPYQVFLLHEIPFDALNETPEIDLHVRDIMNETIKGNISQKIKPQNFFNKLASMPLTGNEAYLYKVPLIALQKNIPKKEVKPKLSFDADVLKQMMLDAAPNKEAEIASSPREIDLHIERLATDHLTMNNSEMLHVQLEKFQQSMDRAIASGLDKFYAIHGNGSGKLKKEIHRLLRNYKEVKSFNNEYHPKYGFGATEIVLR